MSDSNVSLRDEFAKAIIPALIATAANPKASGDMVEEGESIVAIARVNGWQSETSLHDGKDPPFTLAGFIAMEAYEIADALMRERTRPVFPMAPIGGREPSVETLGHSPAHPIPDVTQSTTQSGAIPDGPADGLEPSAEDSESHDPGFGGGAAGGRKANGDGSLPPEPADCR